MKTSTMASRRRWRVRPHPGPASTVEPRTGTVASTVLLLVALAASATAQDGPFPPEDWPASADGEALVHFGSVDFGLGPLGPGWQDNETLTLASGGDQQTTPITIGGFEAVKLTATYLNIIDFDFFAWADEPVIDILLQVWGDSAVLQPDGNPRNYTFLTGTLPELNFPTGGSIPTDAVNGKWNWVLFRIFNDDRPSGEGRFVGVVPFDAQGDVTNGGVNGGTIRIESVTGLIVRAFAFGVEGAFGEPEQVNQFFAPEPCDPEPDTNHAWIDINSGESQNVEVLNGGDQTVTFADDIGPEDDKRRAVRADGRFMNFGITEEFLGAPCAPPRTVKICIEFYDDPALVDGLFGPEAYATDDGGGIGFVDPIGWQLTRGTGQWVKQAYSVPAVSLFGVNAAPLTAGPRLAFDTSGVYISRFDIAVERVGDHPLAGQDPLADCPEDPAVCAGEYGFYAELDYQNDVYNGIDRGNSGGDQEMIEEEAGPAEDRRLAVRAAHGDGTPGFAHQYINWAMVGEPFGPTSQPNAVLAICVTYWDNPDVFGATFRPEVYRSVQGGVENFAFTPASASVVIDGTNRWRDAYWIIPNIKFSGVNQGPQAAARFTSSDRIHISRVRYAVIRNCGPTAGFDALEACRPVLSTGPVVDGFVRITAPSNTSNWTLEETEDYQTWLPSIEVPFIEDDKFVVEFPVDGSAPARGFRLSQ